MLGYRDMHVSERNIEKDKTPRLATVKDGILYLWGIKSDGTEYEILNKIDISKVELGAGNSAELENRIINLEKLFNNLEQPDWNEADNSKHGYINNKPFYFVNDENKVGKKLTLDYHENVAGVQGGYSIPEISLEYKLVIYDNENKLVVETDYFTPYVNSRNQTVLAEYGDPYSDFYIQFYRYQSGAVYYTIKNTSLVGGYAQLISVNKNYVRPDPYLLGNLARANSYLYLNNDEELEWTKEHLITSPNGTLYKIIVNNDGTLSTEITT